MDTEIDTGRLAERLREQTAAFAAAVDGVDPETWVPTCPEWRLRTLVGHIGQGHRWAAGIVRSGGPAAIPDVRDADPGLPAEWPGWLRAGAEELVDAVKHTGAGTPVWAFVGPAPARFWLRRMVADTAVHHADAARTAGTPFTLAADLAADVISEGLGLVTAPGATAIKPALAHLRGDGQTLRLRPDEPAEPDWLITRTPGGPTWERRSAVGPADVTLTGPVADLLLVLSRRLPLGDGGSVTLTGDRALAEHWLAHTAI